MDVGPVYASQIKKLRKRICRVELAPLLASSYTQYLLYKAQDPFSTCRQSNRSDTFIFLSSAGNLDVGPVYASQIKKHRTEEIFSGRFDSLGRSVVTYIYSVEPMRTIQVFLNKFVS